jgi:DNA ligase (NAD+)
MTERIQELEQQILLHKRRYYDGEPIISDAEYDALEEELRKLDPDNPVLFIVGTPEGGKVTHEIPMLSCQKASDVAEVVKWAKNKPLYAGYKLDGLSLSLVYENGRLKQAATRGNGLSGDDVTISVMNVDAIPKTIPYSEKVNIRGEIFMPLSEFERINNELEDEEKYSSPRNLAVGTLRQKEPALLKERRLDFRPFDVLGLDTNLTTEQISDILREWGFNPADFKAIPHHTKKEISEFFQGIAYKRETELDFEIDGIVFKYDSPKDRAEAGETEHHPKWQIALKFESKGEATKVLGITWQVGRTGALTPVAELEPVEVAGATISRATLHNADFLLAMDVAVGDTVALVRSGDVIPRIISIEEKGPRSASLPDVCPSCNAHLKRIGVNLVCTSENCPDRDHQIIMHWVYSVDIKGLGPESVRKLYDEGLVKEPADLYDSSLTEEKLVELLGSNGEKIKARIEDSRRIAFNVFIAALGIPTVGWRMGKVLASNFESFDELRKATVSQLIQLEGISDVTARNIIAGINEPTPKLIIDKGVEIVYTTTDTTTPGEIAEGSKGRIYVTGKIEGMTKDEVRKYVESKGYEWSTSISSNLTLLVLGEKPGGSKIEKAEKLGIEMLNWDEFSSRS